MKKLIIFALAALLAADCGTAFAAKKAAPDWAPAQTENKHVVAAPQDPRLTSGDWTALAAIYPIPGAKAQSSEALTPELLSSWWNLFGDETLTKLITKALDANRNLAASRARVTEARASLGVSRANLLPWLDTSNYWNNGRTPAAAGGSGSDGNLYRLGLDASWEIDIFGGTRATVKAKKANLEAQYAALYSTWTSLASEVAINYISLRTLQERLDIAKYNLGLQMNSVEIQQSKVDSGLSDSLALKQAQYTMEQTRAAIPTIEASIEETKNALAVLTGEVPGALEETLAAKGPIPAFAERALVGIPANAIRQRPDIRQAERLLMAQLMRKKAAQKDLWPKFYLTGSIGTEGTNWGSLFEGPAKLYSFMPRISWPIFHAGAIRNNIKVQDATAQQLLNSYEQTVLTATGEVRNAISAYLQEYEKSASLKRGVEAALAALDIANDKYANGIVDFTTVIAAQSSLTSLSESYAISRGKISTTAVQLFKALGGGWLPMDEAEKAMAEAEAAAKKKK